MRQRVMLLAFAASALLVKAQLQGDEAPVDETPAPTPEPTPSPPGATPLPTIATAPPPVSVTKYCDEDTPALAGRCNADGDNNGKCNQETFACECSEGFGAKDLGDGKWSYAGCYEEERETNALLGYPDGKCDDSGNVPTGVQKTLLGAAASASGGKVVAYSFLCQSINLLVTLGVPATKAKELAAPGFDLATKVSTKVNEAVATDPTAKAAIEAALPSGTKPAEVVAEVAPSKLPPPVAPPGATPVPATPVPPGATPAPTPKSLIPELCTGDVANAKVARKIDGVCTALQCLEGFVRKQPAGTGVGAVCNTAPTNPDDLTCLADGDCPADRVCSDSKCILPTPVPTKAAVKEELSFEFETNACERDADCRVNGDPAATCNTATNECACSTGYEPLSATVKTCVKKEATTVQLNVRLVFGNGNCNDFSPGAISEAKRIIADLTTGTVTGFVSSCGAGIQLSVAAAVSALRSKAVDLAGTSFKDAFNTAVSKKAEIAAKTIAELRKQGSVTSAAVATYSTCPANYATRTVLDAGARCQALACVTDAVLVKNGQKSECQYQGTRGHYEDDDDDLTDGEWAGIAIGIVIFVAVVAAVIFFFLRSSSAPEEAAKETEPAGTGV